MREKLNKRTYRRTGRLEILYITIAAATAITAWSLDSLLKKNNSSERGRVVLSMDFEENPIMSGWKSLGDQNSWTGLQSASGKRSVKVEGQGWISPLVESEPSQWYRLSFRSRAKATGNALQGETAGTCLIIISDLQANDNERKIELEVPLSSDWEISEFRFRTFAPHPFSEGVATQIIRIWFNSKIKIQYYVDDVVLERANENEVAKWADKDFGKVSGRFTNEYREKHLKFLPMTMEKLRGRKRLNIALVGDESHNELVNAPLDFYLERAYPGCNVEIVTQINLNSDSGASETLIENFLEKRNVDLLLMGVGQRGGNLDAILSFVDKIQQRFARINGNIEMLFLYNSGRGVDGADIFKSSMESLDYVSPKSMQDEGRDRVVQLAADKRIELLDLSNYHSSFAPLLASGIRSGLPTNADLAPHINSVRRLLRDNADKVQLIGKILEAHFSPSNSGPDLNTAPLTLSMGNPIQTFDAARNVSDRTALFVLRKEYNVTGIERPVLAVIFDQGLRVFNRRLVADEAAFRVENHEARQFAYNFDRPLDLREGRITVYWSIAPGSNSVLHSDDFTLQLYTSKSIGPGGDRRSRVYFTTKSIGVSMLGFDATLEGKNEIEHAVEVPMDNVGSGNVRGKYRMLIAGDGGERVNVEVSSWDYRKMRWQGFIPYDRPGAEQLVMELSGARNLSGVDYIKSIVFETSHNGPILENILVTERPLFMK